jgi:hypothetical protein
MIVEYRGNISRFMGSYKVLIETGGLLRVAVKLMMACASHNVNVFVNSRPIARSGTESTLGIMSLWSI